MTTKPIPKDPLHEELGRAFRKARQAARLSLIDMARALDCSINTIRWHEAGARSLRGDMLVRAAEIMGVPPCRLMPGVNDEAHQ